MHTLLKSGSSLGFAAEQTIQAETMTVTATRTDTLLKDAPGAITVITAAEIDEKPARDLLDILRDTPGISLLGKSVGGRKTISIRGSESRHTLILIDGRRIAASDAVIGHSNFENNWIPLKSIKQVEVVRGPLSSLYGSEALGGVVNIITRPPTDEWHGGIKIGGGTLDDTGGNSSNVGVNFSGPIIKERLGLSLALGYNRDKAVPDEDNPNISELEGSRLYSFSPKLILTPNRNHQFELFANLADEERNFLSSSRGANFGYLYELSKYMVGIGWKGKIGATQSKIDLYKSRIDKLSTKEYINPTIPTREYADIATSEVFNGQTSFEVFSNLITAGFEYRLESIESDSLTRNGGKEEITHKALFIQDEFSLLNNRLRLTTGVRLDNHEYFGSEISPRVYALFKITEKISLRAGYGHAFNAPTGKQMSPGYYANMGPHSFIGNPDLKPETSDSYEVGVEYFDEQLTAKAFYFHKKIEDLLDYTTVAFHPPRRTIQTTNVNEAEVDGIEIEFGAKLSDSFDFLANYNYLDAKNTMDNIPLTGRPEHSFNFRISHQSERLGLKTTLRYQYTGKQFYEKNRMGELEEVSGYSLWHAAINKNLASNFDLQLGVENIGDVRLADKTDLFPYEERGRFFYANLRMRF